MDKVDQTVVTGGVPGVGIVLCTVLGWLAAIISLVRYPFVFGIAAIILGIRVSRRGGKAGMPLVAASILLMAVGLIFNDILYNYFKYAIGV